MHSAEPLSFIFILSCVSLLFVVLPTMLHFCFHVRHIGLELFDLNLWRSKAEQVWQVPVTDETIYPIEVTLANLCVGSGSLLCYSQY